MAKQENVRKGRCPWQEYAEMVTHTQGAEQLVKRSEAAEVDIPPPPDSQEYKEQEKEKGRKVQNN